MLLHDVSIHFSGKANCCRGMYQCSVVVPHWSRGGGVWWWCVVCRRVVVEPARGIDRSADRYRRDRHYERDRGRSRYEWVLFVGCRWSARAACHAARTAGVPTRTPHTPTPTRPTPHRRGDRAPPGKTRLYTTHYTLPRTLLTQTRPHITYTHVCARYTNITHTCVCTSQTQTHLCP